MNRPSKPLSDIVADAEIEAEVHSNYTNHVYYSSSSTREKSREETWVRVKELGHGAFGVVYLERCEESRRTRSRAVKKIRKVISGHNVDYTRELEAVMKFSHEKFKHCFVSSYGWYQSPTHIFISMEYLQHGDLQKHLAHPLSEQEAKRITTQIIEGLGFMHGNGFTHRDLKPGNIMVVNPGPKWSVKIADFGISKRRHELSTSLHTRAGTPGFAAPEAMGIIGAGRSYTSAVDMWSLGAVVYVILTGTLPFSDLQEVLSYCTGRSRFPSSMLERRSVTQHGQQFIMALMVPDGRQRLTSTTAAKHSWMTQSNHRPPCERPPRAVQLFGGLPVVVPPVPPVPPVFMPPVPPVLMPPVPPVPPSPPFQVVQIPRHNVVYRAPWDISAACQGPCHAHHGHGHR
ncbi:hypothetical protein MY3296_001663 [Beauveria thailandica]